MLFLLRQIRRNLLSKNKVTTYLLYGIGEIFLVVVGILIAVQIDDWNKEKENTQKEIKTYQNILNDLRKDSVHFQRIHYLSEIHQSVHYQIFYESIGERTFDDSVPYDLIAVSKTFIPITKRNHEKAIEGLSNDQIRGALNQYFFNEDRARNGVDEFNRYIKYKSREYIENQGMMSMENVFDDNSNGMPRGAVINYTILRRSMEDPLFMSLIGSLRLTMGYFLLELENLIKSNAALIKELEADLKKKNN